MVQQKREGGGPEYLSPRFFFFSSNASVIPLQLMWYLRVTLNSLCVQRPDREEKEKAEFNVAAEKGEEEWSRRESCGESTDIKTNTVTC